MLGWGTVAGVASAGALVPYPYVIESPGPTYNVLGEVSGQRIIEIPGQHTYPAQGELRMTTVSLLGGPGSPVTGFDLVKAWASGTSRILPEQEVYPPETTREQVTQSNQLEMTASQSAAIAAALTHQGFIFTSELAVQSVTVQGPSDGLLMPDDIILSVNGQQARDAAGLRALVAQRSGAPVTVRVRRDGTERTVGITPQKKDDAWLLGVVLTPKYDFPFTPAFHLQGVGGPSAGLMFSLGIIDELEPGDLTGGKSFAGTGTIDAAGRVGPIGGIQQKMIGARKSGAEYFLAPADNCGEVVGHVPDGLTVIRVSTLEEAYSSVSAIGRGATPQSSSDAFRACT